MFTATAVLWAVVALGQNDGVAAAQETSIFKAGGALVKVDTEVTDGTKVLGGFQKDDFRILDNGTEQPILYFSQGEEPLDLILLFDLSGSMTPRLKKLSESAQGALRFPNRSHFTRSFVRWFDELQEGSAHQHHRYGAWRYWFVLDSRYEHPLDYLDPTKLEMVGYAVGRGGWAPWCDAAVILLCSVSIQRNAQIPEMVSDHGSLSGLCSRSRFLRGSPKLCAIENFPYYLAVLQPFCRAMLCGIAFSGASGRSRAKSNRITEVGSVLCNHEGVGFVGRIVDRNQLFPGGRNAVCLCSR
jgi:hypothetical protein